VAAEHWKAEDLRRAQVQFQAVDHREEAHLFPDRQDHPEAVAVCPVRLHPVAVSDE
jgi:hypothetical protein